MVHDIPCLHLQLCECRISLYDIYYLFHCQKKFCFLMSTQLDCFIMLSLPCLNNQLVSESDVGASINRRTVKHLSPSLRMMSLLMNTANPWKRMEHGPDIWNCKQLLLLHIVIYAFIGWDLLSLPLACLILSCIWEFW